MEVEHSWEMGSILVSLEGTPLVAYESPTDTDKWEHGAIKHGSMLLPYQEAMKLMNDLSIALQEYDRIEEQAQKDLEG